MAYGSDSKGTFGFSDCQDWLCSVVASFPAPWKLDPLDGKYYGTVILDSEGNKILSLWDSEGEPSWREKAKFREWTKEAWLDYCVDCHWESERTLQRADSVCEFRNRLIDDKSWREDGKDLCAVLMRYCDWHEDAYPSVNCGGKDRRRLESNEFRVPWEA